MSDRTTFNIPTPPPATEKDIADMFGDRAARPVSNSMVYWWPILRHADVPTPATVMVSAPHDLYKIIDGKQPTGMPGFLRILRAIGSEFGWPCFLRTSDTSGKHEWKHTCCVTDPANLASHVARLVNFCECAGFFGLDYSFFAVRQMLRPCVRFHAFDGLPICREFRFLIDNGEVKRRVLYWPRDAFENAAHHDTPLPSDWREQLDRMEVLGEDESAALNAMALKVAERFRGSGAAWSVDFMDTENGWHCIDMALARDSWWPEPNP